MNERRSQPTIPQAPQSPAPVAGAVEALSQRITDYLSSGGLFNPELANHDAVRDLLIDCRAALHPQPAPAVAVEALTVKAIADMLAQRNGFDGVDGAPKWVVEFVQDTVDALAARTAPAVAEKVPPAFTESVRTDLRRFAHKLSAMARAQEAGHPWDAFDRQTLNLAAMALELACGTTQPMTEASAELKRDAARWRWIRDEAIWRADPDGRGEMLWAVVGTRHDDCTPIDGTELDAAVDERLRAAAPPTVGSGSAQEGQANG